MELSWKQGWGLVGLRTDGTHVVSVGGGLLVGEVHSGIADEGVEALAGALEPEIPRSDGQFQSGRAGEVSPQIRASTRV